MIKVFSAMALVLFSIFGWLFSNQKYEVMPIDYPSYEKEWKEVAEQEKLGKTKSANDLVEKIYDMAKKDDNAPQVYKSLMHLSKYTMILEEDSELTIVNRFKQEIKKAESPAKNLLQSSLAELYWQYYNSNRYKFLNRTTTDGGIDQEDFRTWDLNRLFSETSSLFDASLQNAEETKTAAIEDFKDILSGQKEIFEYQYLRPTLYDLLLHRAIDFYANDQSGLTKPTHQFILRDEQAFASINQFLNYQPATEDSLSNILKTIQLYQALLQFHQAAKNEEALILADVERLKYIHQNANIPQKDDLYEDALKEIYSKNKKVDAAAMAGYEIAELYRVQGHAYHPVENTENQWKLKEAVEFAEKVVQQFPNTLGANNCQSLIYDIKYPSVSIQSNQNISVNEPIRLKVDYKNLDQLYYTIKSISPAQIKELNPLYREERITYLSKLETVETWTGEVPNEGDFQNHSFEEIVNEGNGLPAGQYVIIASAEKDFANNSSKVVGHQVIQVSDIAYYLQRKNGYYNFFVKHRQSGKPIPNAKVTLSNDLTQYGAEKFSKSFSSDENGYFRLTLPEEYYSNLEIEIEALNQHAIFGDFYYNSRSYDRKERWRGQAFIFTDRSIYRPGQTIYFKGIYLETNGTDSRLLKNETATVTFYDANGEKIENVQVRTNQFGSAQGSFTIPQGRLLGLYRINFNNDGNVNISVEEYKRPRFQVEIDSLSGNYKLGDNIEVEGIAMAYAGSTISNASVSYRVTRQVRYPYWFHSWWRPIPRGESQEIAFGETTTDEQGKFVIPFTAIPDESVSAEDLPVFHYNVQVDVTDINGETRSESMTVRIGYVVLDLAIEIDAELEKSKEHELTVFTKNLNGKPVAAQGDVKIYKLISPDRVLVNRKWQQPDQQEISKEEWKKLFPYEPYNEQEANPRTWENGAEVLSANFETKEDDGKTVVDLETGSWKTGWYRVVVESKDAFGKEVKQQREFEVADQQATQVSDNQLFVFSLDQTQYEPGETAILTVGTAAEDLEVFVEIYRDDEVIDSRNLQLTDEIERIEIPIKEEDRGGLAIVYSFIKWNEFRSGREIISVPWSNKELSIEVGTFRDKLKPGHEETWTFTVKGEKGDQVSAEFLTAMYDASLDQFRSHNWYYHISRRNQGFYTQITTSAFGVDYFDFDGRFYEKDFQYKNLYFPGLNFFGMNLGNGGRFLYRKDRVVTAVPQANRIDIGEVQMAAEDSALEAVVVTGDEERKNLTGAVEVVEEEGDDSSQKQQESLEVAARTNLNETAFFFPQLTTDDEGNVSFSFTTPEALTEWNVMALAHTEDLKFGEWKGSTITQKELMVIPNAPRFFRQGDEISMSTKISNLTDQKMSGQAELVLLDATTLKPVYSKFAETSAIQNFEINAAGNTSVEWTLTIPDDVPAVTYRVLAKAGNFSDGEENALLVLSNRKLVTETLPIPLRSNETKNFVLDKLRNNNSSTLKHHKLTLEMTSNPAWYGVQALPYLMEYPYECSEQTFARYYANSLATHVANSDPKIKSVFDAWRNYQPEALQSNLEKNQELKELLLRETPWVRDANDEAEQKRRIGVLFDLNRMADEQNRALNQLRQMQYPSGGWPWFAGGLENRFITQHIVAGMGHLDKLEVKSIRDNNPTWNMTTSAIQYLDVELKKQFEDLKRYNENWQEIESVPYIVVHYFYTRSFFRDVPVNASNKEAFDFYFEKMKEDWLSDQLYRNGLAALAFHRYDESSLAIQIVTSLDEQSITNEEMGMYWKSNVASWWWYQAPIETQALMIEVFDEVANNQSAVDELKVWLLKNKQTNSWETTKATSEAVYALLLRGGNWLAVDDLVEIKLGGKEIDPKKMEDVKVEAGTGYFKTSWSGGEIKPKMAEVTATKKGDGIAWGALYWQYFEDLDKISSHETPLKLQKSLFLQENTSSGPKIRPIQEGRAISIGDLVKVRIELRVDRDMEFVHMKDMRAAGFEPTNVISRYKWQDALGYYESTKDASTDFFFDYLPKGVYVFEYPLRANNKGDFSNGITTIQSMYAPEFTSHSEGVRLRIGE